MPRLSASGNAVKQCRPVAYYGPLIHMDGRLSKVRMYRERAAKARSEAASMTFGEAYSQLIEVATHWEFLADRLEERVKLAPRDDP